MPPRSLLEKTFDSFANITNWSDDDSASSFGSSIGRINVAKTVSFAEEATEYEIIHKNDIPKEDIGKIWYMREEYTSINKDNRTILSSMNAGTMRIENNEQSSRGLEKKTKLGSMQRHKHRQNAMNAVLDEQEFQWGRKVWDPERIAKCYVEAASLMSRSDAARKGKIDQVEAEKIYVESITELKERRKEEELICKKKKSKRILQPAFFLQKRRLV